MRRLAMLLTLAAAVAACGDAEVSEGAVDVFRHATGACSGRFVAHDLPHVTTGGRTSTSLFDGTGSGVAVEDLDDDDHLDIVLANLSGDSTILWNQGGLQFEAEPLVRGRFRHVSIADGDGDGLRDIVLTTGVGSPILMRSVGDAGRPGFERTPLPGVDAVAYSMAWADLGGDGDLDLVTGGYNAELTASRDVSSLLGTRGGVFVYENDGALRGERLTDLSQALVVRLTDVDGDGRLDAWVGNDLATPDEVYRNTVEGWTLVEPFPASTFSTMSLDRGDVDNDGDLDLFTTDMHPMDDSPETRAAWEPIMEDMASQPIPESVQRMENVLVAPVDSGFVDVDLGLRFTGWSWSGLFGDLDNDTMLDIYVVNGMEAESLFDHLPGAALVEENQAFRNDRTMMQPAPEWGLADTAGGRGMAMGDLDGDGDLDIVVNNLNAPSRLFENQLCAGSAITVELEWQGAADDRAIGSTVRAQLDDVVMTRTLETTRGYLSTSPATAHFGVGEADSVEISVAWPDGLLTGVGSVEAGSHVVVTRPIEDG